MNTLKATASLAAILMAAPLLAMAQDDSVERLDAESPNDEEARQATVVVTGSALRGRAV